MHIYAQHAHLLNNKIRLPIQTRARITVYAALLHHFKAASASKTPLAPLILILAPPVGMEEPKQLKASATALDLAPRLRPFKGIV